MTASSRPGTRAAPSGPGETTVGNESIDEFVRSHAAYVARLAYRLLGRDDEVDDVVQDVFVAFLRFHRDIREAGAVRAWLATTTVRTVHKRLRSRSRRLRALFRLETDSPAPETAARSASPEDHAALARIHAALETVAPKIRTAWVLRYLEQETNEEVARICNCSLATAKRRIARANAAVQEAVGGE